MFCLVVIGVCAGLVLRDAERLRDERLWYRAARFGALGFASVGIVGLYWRELPHEVFASAVLGALAPALVLGAVSKLSGVPDAHRRSLPHLVVNGAAIVLAIAGFAWLLPKLPGIVRLYWDRLGESGYASPSTLWWVLALLAFNTACMELAYRLLHDSRIAMLRFAEGVFTTFNLGAVIIWLGVAADALPGIDAMQPAFIAAAVTVGVGVSLALSHAPAMMRYSAPVDEPPI